MTRLVPLGSPQLRTITVYFKLPVGLNIHNQFTMLALLVSAKENTLNNIKIV